RQANRVMSRPNNETDPLSAGSSPVIRLNNVVLPAPFGPMINRRSPGSTARLTFVVTCRPPNDLLSAVTASAVLTSGPQAAQAPRVSTARGRATPCGQGAPRRERALPA